MARKRRSSRKAVPPPLMMAELMLSSWETIARRTWMMSQGTCSDAEYQRMVREKTEAAMLSGLALTRGAGAAAVMGPWRSRSVANSKRLRKKKS